MRNIPLNLFSEFVDTFILVFAICGIGQTVADSTGVNYVYVFAIITAIAFSFGGVTGFALNPARDLSPRIAYYLLCPGEKKDPDWSYAWVPVVGPVCGAVAAVLVYGVLPLPM